MSAPARTSLISKLHRVLKQRFKPISHDGDRPLMEQMLFACCLENAPYEKAEKAFQSLASSFFDWNEVRVSTVKELAEVIRDLPYPDAAASNVKRLLQNVFESTYSFEIESVKKQNIGVGIKRLAKLEGATPFVVAYATQQCLGGHAIPLDRGAIEVLYIVGIASDAERASGNIPGMERAIPKNRGHEFSSLLHQLAAEFVANPMSANVKTVLLAINPGAKDRLPKRGQKWEFAASAAERAAAAKDAAKQVMAKDGKKPGVHLPDAKKSGHAGKGREVKPAAKDKRRAGAVSGSSRHSTGRAASAQKQLAKRKPR